MRKYDSEKTIIKDMNIVIKSKLSDNAKIELLHSLAWAYTENNGKIKGCKYWSEDAINKYKNGVKVEFRHEHVIPRNIFVNSVLEKKCKITKKVLDNRLVGCVVTADEAKRLDRKYKTTHPDNEDFFNIKNVWGRYEEVGIKYCEVKWKKIGRTKQIDED